MTPREKLMFYWDSAERIVATFVAAFFAVWVGIVEATESGYTLDTLFAMSTLKGALAGALFTLVKTQVGRSVGAKSSASLLPKHLDPPPRN